MTTSVDIRRAPDRGANTTEWLDSKHSFSFAVTTTPTTPTTGCCSSTTTTGWRPAPASTPTRTATWRSSPGCCRARWSTGIRSGNSGVIYPGLAQRMSAGTRYPALGEERILQSEASRAFRTDVGGPRRVGHRTRLSAARDRRRVSWRGGLMTIASGSPTRRRGHHDPQQERRTARRAAAARRERRTAGGAVPAPVRRRAARSRSRARASCMTATPSGSPHRAASASPQPNRPRSSSGRCMRDLAAA